MIDHPLCYNSVMLGASKRNSAEVGMSLPISIAYRYQIYWLQGSNNPLYSHSPRSACISMVIASCASVCLGCGSAQTIRRSRSACKNVAWSSSDAACNAM
jgi:hypothetical protein